MSTDVITIPLQYPLSLIVGMPDYTYADKSKTFLYWKLICHTLNSFDLFYCNHYYPALVPRQELAWFNLQTDFANALWRVVSGLTQYAGCNCYLEFDGFNIYLAMNTWE